jgi:hypothetical protein
MCWASNHQNNYRNGPKAHFPFSTRQSSTLGNDDVYREQDSVVRSSSPWVGLIQSGCGLRACLARQTIGRPIKRFCAPVRGWPRASCNSISRSRLASGESEQHLLSEVGLGRAKTAFLCSFIRTRAISISHGLLSAITVVLRLRF